MNENVGIIETEDTRFTREREREDVLGKFEKGNEGENRYRLQFFFSTCKLFVESRIVFQIFVPE